MTSDFPAVAGVSEVADICKVSRQRAWQLTRERTFPAPVTVLAATPIWLVKDVKAWQKRRERKRERMKNRDNRDRYLQKILEPRELSESDQESIARLLNK